MSVHGEGHLGGYIVGGDPATWYPTLWQWLVEVHDVESVIDVGCGEGRAVEFFRKLGCDAWGVDGIRQPSPFIWQHDFTTGPFDPWFRLSSWATQRFDLCWSCEFVEHVEEEFVPNFLDTFEVADLVLMTHAAPGQTGYHHVNCRTSLYWQGALEGRGFKFDADLTEETREIARVENDNPWNHYARSGLAFTRG